MPTPSPTDPLVQNTNGFYNALCSALNLSNKQFQLIQGAQPVATNAAALYNIFDGMPPASVAQLYTANPVNKASGNYQNVLGAAIQPPSFSAKIAMANYLNANNWLASGTWVPPGNPGTNPIYSPALSDLFTLVNGGSQALFSYDSSIQNSSLDGAWANSSSGGGVWFWGTSSSSSSTVVNTKAAESRITVAGGLYKYAMVPIDFGGWYSSAYLSAMYQAQSLWTPGYNPDWNEVFGPTGSWQNVATSVLLTNGYTFNITSYASYTQEDYNYVSQSSDTNVWPFYSSSSSSSSKSDYKYNTDGSITTTVSCPVGNLQILGFDVSTMSSLMGKGTPMLAF
jgi:hypothetical protein